MGMNEGLVVKWLKHEGDTVEQGDPLVEIETAKINSEVEAPASGTLTRISVGEGETVDIGTRLAMILAPGEDEAALSEQDVPSAPIKQTGPIEPGMAGDRAIAPAGPRRQATPVARRLAKELGVAIDSVEGTGPSGRITEADVRRSASSSSGNPNLSNQAVPVKKKIKLAGMRATIARRMTDSSQAPTVTLNTHVDVTDTVALQRRLVSEWRPKRIRPQYQDLVLAATVRALVDHPAVNAHLVGNEVHILTPVNLGVAFAVSDGLLVPVVQDANKKSLVEIAQAIRDIGAKVKSNDLSVDELTTGTFTVTNLGTYEVEEFNPLLNPPQVGILGIGRVEERPVVVDGVIVIRSVGSLSLTFDHRALDGAPAADFLKTLAGFLKSPDWMID
jgi:pyruvate dehydrogenase E2 component (dihydrolipoamide acetyltransferase)